MQDAAVWQFALLGLFERSSMRLRGLRRFGIAVRLPLVQLTLGITNVPAGLPLLVAVAHNGVAALLLATLVMLNFAVYTPSSFR
jgi:cytochrome c oxidase assembly protein subunit 15